MKSTLRNKNIEKTSSAFYLFNNNFMDSDKCLKLAEFRKLLCLRDQIPFEDKHLFSHYQRKLFKIVQRLAFLDKMLPLLKDKCKEINESFINERSNLNKKLLPLTISIKM